MRKYASLVILMLLVNLNYSCSKKQKQETLKVSSFNKIGIIHNQFLTNIKNNFEIDENIAHEQDKIDFINQFNVDFANSLNLTGKEKRLLIEGLSNNKNFIKQSYLIDYAFHNYSQLTVDTTENYNIFQIIENLKNDGLIGTKSYYILTTLAEQLQNHYEGEISDSELKLTVQQLVEEFNSSGYDINGEGEMVASILAIATYSLEWWEDNQTTEGAASRLFAVPAWAGADIVGGIISGAVAASGQAILNGEVDWRIVAWAAAGGAINSSTGAVGKILK